MKPVTSGEDTGIWVTGCGLGYHSGAYMVIVLSPEESKKLFYERNMETPSRERI